MAARKLFLVILATSAGVASILWRGWVDQDFFSYYYIGQGILEGRAMYSDFFENKGPVSYGFFALLAAIFGDNYGWALVAASTVVDAAAVFFGLLAMKEWYGAKESGWWGKRPWLEAAAVTIIYKSLSIGVLMGGVYTQSIAMALLAASWWLMEKRRFGWSGVLISCSVMARQTMVFFLVPSLVRLIVKKAGPEAVVRWMAGGAGAVMIILAVVGGMEGPESMFENMVTLSTSYSRSVSPDWLKNVMTKAVYEVRLIYMFILVVVGTVYVWSRESRQEKWWFGSVVGASLMSTYVGGIFYFHHFVQMAPAVAASYFFRPRTGTGKIVYRWVITIILVAVASGYGAYLWMGKTNLPYTLNYRLPKIKEMDGKKYLVAVGFPRLYIDYKMQSPDRYFFPNWIVFIEGEMREKHQKQHFSMDRDRVRQTAFISIKSTIFPKEVSDVYMAKAVSAFDLERKNIYEYGGVQFEVWGSR